MEEEEEVDVEEGGEVEEEAPVVLQVLEEDERLLLIEEEMEEAEEPSRSSWEAFGASVERVEEDLVRGRRCLLRAAGIVVEVSRVERAGESCFRGLCG